MKAGGQCHVLTTLPPEKRHGARFTLGWLGPSDSLGGCGIRTADRPVLSV